MKRGRRITEKSRGAIRVLEKPDGFALAGRCALSQSGRKRQNAFPGILGGSREAPLQRKVSGLGCDTLSIDAR